MFRRTNFTILPSPVLLGFLACSGSFLGCSEPHEVEKPRATRTVASPSASAAPATSTALPGPDALLTDAGAAPLDDRPYDGPTLGALFLQTPIMSDMEWPIREELLRPGEKQRSMRIGYIRRGARVPVIPEAHQKSNCSDGWYELVQGGFVCGRYASLDANHPKFKTAPHGPNLTGPLPYQYGINLTNGTPLYKHIPAHDERLLYEPWLSPKRVRPRPDDDSDDSVATAPAAMTTSPLVAVSATDPMGLGASDPSDAGIPWYLRDYDGGKPQVTLDELREGDGSPIEKRMVKGFYLSLDADDTHFGARWWHTQTGFWAPYERVYIPPKTGSDFHGVWLNQPTLAAGASAPGDAGAKVIGAPIETLPVGFVLSVRAKKYSLSDDGTRMLGGEHVSRFTPMGFTGKTATVERVLYQETTEGWWFRAFDGTSTKPGPAPRDLAAGEKWIDVNLENETLVAFEGDRPVYATLISSGKRDLDHREKDHPTKNGTFRIREKHIAATMDADTASDGPYSIEDVPWIQYFNGNIALHGAFWHSNFGHVQSHGCVNLAPWDAKALFGWTEPRLPAGWHGVAATEEHPGTRVILHDEKPPIPRDGTLTSSSDLGVRTGSPRD